VPETEALLPRFRAAHTQVLGVSVDSVYCHAAWGASMGGISFPLLADFQPRGKLAGSLGLFLEAAGITDRATVIIDKDGIVRYAASVGPPGRRNIEDLAAECEKVDGANPGQELPSGPGLPSGSVLYIRSNCGASRAAAIARDNLHLADVAVKNVSADSAARAELEKISGGAQAPCLVVDGAALLEADAIIARFVKAAGVL